MFQERTLLDLLVEYHLDIFDAKPIEAHRQADGEIQLKNTGDSLIDKWEQQIADGDEPDLLEAFTPESIERINKLRTASDIRNQQGGMTMRDALEHVEKVARMDELRSTKANSKFLNKTLKNAVFNTFGSPDDE